MLDVWFVSNVHRPEVYGNPQTFEFERLNKIISKKKKMNFTIHPSLFDAFWQFTYNMLHDRN